MFTPYFSRQLGSKVKSMHYITRWYIEWGQGQARSNVRNLFARWRERILVGCFTCFFGDEKISRMRVFANSPHLSSSLALSALESEVLTLPQRNTWLDSVRGNICHSHLEKEKKKTSSRNESTSPFERKIIFQRPDTLNRHIDRAFYNLEWLVPWRLASIHRYIRTGILGYRL